MVAMSITDHCRGGLSVGLILLFVALGPFAGAQSVHHELAAADTDGHEHSDNDLCQWVESHIAGVLDVDVPRPAFRERGELYELPAAPILRAGALSFAGPSRAPPALH